MSEFGGRRFQRRSFCVQEDSSHSSCNTLFVLDSHSKAIDMDQVEKKLGGIIFHGAGPAKAFTPEVDTREVLPQHRQVVVQHLWKNKLILIKSILSIVVNNNIKCFNYRWIGGEYGRGGRFPEGCQETRLPKLAGERAYRFLVVCESSSYITNLRDVQSGDIRVLLARQSSLNTLKGRVSLKIFILS